MSLMEHLGELRMRLVRIVVVLLVSCLIFYLATPTIAQFMLMPVAQYLPANEDGQVLLNVFGAFDAFGLRFQIAFWASLVATAPFILWQILAFFLPALKPKERKWFVPTFIAGVGLFILGTIFCYLIILPPAIINLTDNACKHVPEGGSVKIMLSGVDDKSIIAVKDNGVGFGDINPSLLFKRFYRTDFSRSRVKGGSGLGLSIVQAIVEGNDGNITAFNDPEGGAVFLIAFPSVIDR